MLPEPRELLALARAILEIVQEVRGRQEGNQEEVWPVRAPKGGKLVKAKVKGGQGKEVRG